MAKLLLLIIIVYLFTQTPFYHEQVAPQFKDFEATLTNLLTSNPQDIKQRRYPSTDPSPTVTIQRPAVVAEPVDTSISTFMSEKSSDASGLKR